MKMFVELSEQQSLSLELAFDSSLRDYERRWVPHPRGGFSSPRFVVPIEIHNDRIRLIGDILD